MLGKRKRDVRIVRREERDPVTDTKSPGPDLFRKYFETSYEPLPELTRTTQSPLAKDVERASEGSSDNVSEASSWDGLADDDSLPAVHVVDHGSELTMDGDPERGTEFKSFMSSKPPGESKSTTSTTKANVTSDAKDDDGETANLKHDLDLQRLLKESHLLEQAKVPSNPGKHRHRAVDMRLQDLGSKETLFAQEKMPLSHRKGIGAKALVKESLRRKDAKENGVILERATGGSKASATRRERGVDKPSLGKFSNGMLKLSRQDIASMSSPGPKTARRSKTVKPGRR